MRISQRVIRFSYYRNRMNQETLFVLQTLLLPFDAFIFYDYVLTFQKHATSKYGTKMLLDLLRFCHISINLHYIIGAN